MTAVSSKQLAVDQRTVSRVACRGSRQDAGSRGEGHGSRVHCTLRTAHYPLSTAGAAIGLLMWAAAILFQAAPAHADAVDNLKKTYAGIETVEARFNQKILISTLKRERESKGDFYYKRGKGFLWRYTSPSRKVFLYDGKVLWQADEEQPFVIKERVDKAKVQGSFLDLVEDVSKLDEYFTIQEVAQDKDGFVFLLLPKKEGMLKQARMWVDTKYLVRQIEITEITGNTNTLSFSSIKVNKPLDDALFILNPGKKEIMER